MSLKKVNLSIQVLVALFAGMLLGILLNSFPSEWSQNYLIGGLFHVLGQMFFSALQLLVVPVVFFSLTCGVASIGSSVAAVGRIGIKTFVFYTLTTMLAITLAIIGAVIVGPGVGFELTSNSTFDAASAPGLAQVFIDFIPTNPIKAMAEANMIQIIVLSFLVGAAIANSGENGERVLRFFEDMNEVFMKVVTYVISAAPIGVFCLMAKVFAEQGFSAIAPLATYFFLILGVLTVHVLLVYGGLLKLYNLSLLHFLRQFKEVMIFAFSTSSSNATIPVTLRVTEKKLGVSNSVASFTIPLGATINMDGTAIMQGVATVFISQAYGVEIGLSGYLTVIGMAVLASVGTAGVPGVGLVTLTMVLNQVGLPVEGIALILGVDRILDMARTAVNVTGDAVVTCAVAKSEGQLNEKIFWKN